MIPLLSPTEFSAALACQDRHIRILDGAEVLLDIPTVAAPTALQFCNDSHDQRGRFPGAKELLYSTDNGLLVQLLCDKEATRQGFTLANPKKLGAIKAMYSGELSIAGVASREAAWHVLRGRTDAHG